MADHKGTGLSKLRYLDSISPPRNDSDADAQLLEELRLFSTRPNTIIVGDFNAPRINWSSSSADCSEAEFDQQLLRSSDNLLLTQHVIFPTRVCEGQQMNCLDLVFTKSFDSIDVVNCLPSLGQGDLVVLLWKYTLFSLPTQPLDSRPNIWRGDFEQMKKDLSPIDWASTLSGDIEEDCEPDFFSPTCEDEETATLGAVFFTETFVRNELLNLKESTSPGPDATPAKLLKELALEMSKPLALIFQTSFVTGCLPSDWKSATITPLFKGGSRASTNNYRPVSLTSVCCKIMEKIIKKALMQFLEQHHLFSDAQHGFRSSRSCLANLLFTLERWTKARDEGNVVHAIYIDFKKAFDSVPHQRLLHKLRNAGIRGRLLVWIQSFLAGRCQIVQVGRQQSSEVGVVSGIPQGSVLGPTLFLIFINDCVNDLDCDAILFADDIKLWKVIQNTADADHLQANLNRTEDWSKRWLMPFNISK
ncbi:hypothetical protein SprV_0200642500 [Sparganum proliferum]